MVYFIEAVGAGLVKIGFTDGDPEARLKQLQTGCPHKLRLRVSITGDAEREAGLHKAFAHLREQGEWFRLTPEIESLITVFKFIAPSLIRQEGRMAELAAEIEGLRAQILVLISHREDASGPASEEEG